MRKMIIASGLEVCIPLRRSKPVKFAARNTHPVLEEYWYCDSLKIGGSSGAGQHGGAQTQLFVTGNTG